MSVDIKRLTAHLSPQQQAAVRKVYRERAENSTAAFITCFFLGVLGAHRFYLKQWRQGFLHLLLAAAIALVIGGGLLLRLPVVSVVIIAGILLLLALLWVIVDLVRIDDEVAGHNIKLAEMLIAQTLLSDHTVEQQADAKLGSLLHETAAQANDAATYGRMPSPNDTAAAAPISAVGAVSAQYVADTVTQVSDDPNATQHGSQQAAPHTESSVETDTVSDAPPAGAALAGAALMPLVSEVVTRSHDVSGYSVTDGVETMTTASIPTPQPEIAAVEAGALPTSEEANAATWPDYSHVEFDEQGAGARWVAPDVTDRGDIHGDVKPVADIVPAGVLPLHVVFDDVVGSSGAAGAHDRTDDAAVAGLGMAGLAAAAVPFATGEALPQTQEATVPPVVAVEPAAAADVPADDGVLVLMPDEDETHASTPSYETPAASYIPPVVPVLPIAETHEEPAAFAAEPEPFVATAVPAAYEAALEPPPVVHEQPAQAVEPVAKPVQEHHEHSGGEALTGLGALAGLAGLAGLATSAADEAVSLARAHRESLAAAESEQAHAYDAELVEHAAPAQSETLAEVAATPAEAATPAPETLAEVAQPEAEAAPVAEPVEETHTMPELEAVPVAAAAAVGVAAAEEAAAHRKLKRIRVVRQLKVDGKVVEENVAEEYIDPDADPEPVKARLREQLRQRAEARTTE